MDMNNSSYKNGVDSDDFDSLIHDMLKDFAQDTTSSSVSPKNRTIEKKDDGSSSSSSSVMQDALFALEQQLIHMHPAASVSSVGGYVVQSTSSTTTTAPRAQPPTRYSMAMAASELSSSSTSSTRIMSSDAWLQSLDQFESLHLADDFVRADAAKKSNKESQGQGTMTLSSDMMEEYDIHEQPPVYKPMAAKESQPQPQPLQPQLQATPRTMQTQQLLNSVITPFPPLAISSVPMQYPPYYPGMTMPQNSILSHPQAVGPQGQVFSQPLLPPHIDTPIRKAILDPTLGTNPTTAKQLVKIPPVRLFFHDTSTHARPIPATQIPSSYMTPRDLCYVIHSILKPVLSFTSVLDMYNADYYKWGCDQRIQIRKRQASLLLFHYPIPPNGSSTFSPSSTTSTLPNPVWKETKQSAKDMEQEYLTMVQKRAEEFSHVKQNLGKLVKVDVKRPRALLASSCFILNSKPRKVQSIDNNLTEEKDEEESVHNNNNNDVDDGLFQQQEKEEEIQRANMWKARISIDQGYQAYLNLLELRRLLQTRGQENSTTDTTPATVPFPATTSLSLDTKEENHLSDDVDTRRRMELIMDVETQIQKLQSALGISYNKSYTSSTPLSSSSSSTLELYEPSLIQILTLPKGKILVARILEDGILPHGNACFLFPYLLHIIITSTVSNKTKSFSSAVHEDERLLRSVTALVRSNHPSPLPQSLLDCLDVVNKAPVDIKILLCNHPKVLELLHAILTRGMDICSKANEAYLNSWVSKEKEFVNILTSAA